MSWDKTEGGDVRRKTNAHKCPECGQLILEIWADPSKPKPDPPEEVTARCYHRGHAVYQSQSKGRKRKKPPKKGDLSYLYTE